MGLLINLHQKRTERKCLVLLEKIKCHLEELEDLKKSERSENNNSLFIIEKRKKTKALLRIDEAELFKIIRISKKFSD